MNSGSFAARYPALERYVAPARPRAALWRTVLGLLLIVAIYAGALAGLAWVLHVAAGDGFRPLATDIALGRTPAGMLGLLFSFTFLAVGPLIAVRVLHRRTVRSLFGHPPQVVRDFVLAAAVLVVTYGIGLAVSALLPAEPVDTPETLPGLDPQLWLLLLPLSFAGIAVQTLAEELVFRAYLLQQFAARFRSPILWLGVPSVMFAFLHYEPGIMGANAAYVVAATGLFGLVAADLTARTGSIGAAWGLHFANNAAALLIVSHGGVMEGLALRISTLTPATDGFALMIATDAVMLAIVWALCRMVLRR